MLDFLEVRDPMYDLRILKLVWGAGGESNLRQPALEKSRFCSSEGGRSKKLFEPCNWLGRSPVQKRKASFFCAAAT